MGARSIKNTPARLFKRCLALTKRAVTCAIVPPKLNCVFWFGGMAQPKSNQFEFIFDEIVTKIEQK
jgi:hypothetical protein